MTLTASSKVASAQVPQENWKSTPVRGPVEDPLSRITPDVRAGIEQSNSILDMTAERVDREYSEFEAPGYSDIVPTIFLDVEKVIDVAKPEMATYADQDLIDAFIAVPQCQHGVKDANDGQVRYVP